MLECLHPLVIGERKKSGCESFYIFKYKEEHIDLLLLFSYSMSFSISKWYDFEIFNYVASVRTSHIEQIRNRVILSFILLSNKVQSILELDLRIRFAIHWTGKKNSFLETNFLQEFRFWIIKNELQIYMRKWNFALFLWDIKNSYRE